MGNQLKYSFYLCFAFGGLDNVINMNSCFLQIRETCWCLCLADIWHKSLQLMENIGKPHSDQCKEITNDWHYDASYMLTSLPVWYIENLKLIIFAVHSVQTLVHNLKYKHY